MPLTAHSLISSPIPFSPTASSGVGKEALIKSSRYMEKELVLLVSWLKPSKA